MEDTEKALIMLLNNYKEYKLGGVSKAAYNEMRIVIRDAAQKKIGGIISNVMFEKPLRKVMNLTPAIGKEASVMIKRTHNLHDFEPLLPQLQKLGKAARYSKYAGAAGYAVDIYFKGAEVLKAWETGRKKWETTTKNSFALAGGLLVGYGVSVLLAPVTGGLSLIVLVGLGAAGGDILGGKLGQATGAKLDKPENDRLTYVDPYGISHTILGPIPIYQGGLSHIE